MKTLFRPAPLLPAFIGLALLTCVGLASAQDSRGAGVPSVVRNAPVALDVLRGRWVRPDGGYGVVIRSVGADGQLEATSFGKERPAVAGNDEAAYAKNRRVELVAR